jgi:hypothetical protein
MRVTVNELMLPLASCDQEFIKRKFSKQIFRQIRVLSYHFFAIFSIFAERKQPADTESITSVEVDCSPAQWSSTLRRMRRRQRRSVSSMRVYYVVVS